VNEWATPAVVAGKPETLNDEAAAGVTVIDCVPVGVEVAISCKVIVCEPAVFSVAVNEWLPPSANVNADGGGKIACASLLVKMTSRV
jgi:hypothetical protein